jgi:hypothetical protein
MQTYRGCAKSLARARNNASCVWIVVMQQITETQIQYMKWLANRILDEYNLEHGPAVFRRNKRSFCRIFPDKSFQILFGYENADRVYNNGFNEYIRVANMQTGFIIEKGWKALHNLVIHEAAHAVSEIMQQRTQRRQQYHNDIFVAAVELLHEQYKLATMYNIFANRSAKAASK